MVLVTCISSREDSGFFFDGFDKVSLISKGGIFGGGVGGFGGGSLGLLGLGCHGGVAAAPPGRARVLLVEDEEAVRRLVMST